MNYLTNYYKNLCEQLQEKINILEANIRSASEIQEIGNKKYREAVDDLERKLGRRLTVDEFSEIAKHTIKPYAQRAMAREMLVQTATKELPSVAATGDVETATQYADVMGDIAKENISGKGLGFHELGQYASIPQMSAQRRASVSQSLRQAGIPTLVPADIAAMRKFIQMGRGQYQAPFPQPESPVNGMHVTPQQY